MKKLKKKEKKKEEEFFKIIEAEKRLKDSEETKRWEGLISILAGEAKLLTDIKRNLLIIINEMQLMKEEKKHDGYGSDSAG